MPREEITVDFYQVNEATSAVRILVTSLTVEQIKQADLKVRYYTNYQRPLYHIINAMTGI